MGQLLRIDACGLTIVIRSASESLDTWRSDALALPAEAKRVSVLVTPQASATNELTDTLRELVSGLLGGNELGLWMLPLGAVGSVETIDRWAQLLAGDTGREIVVPHGETVLGPDGWPIVFGPDGQLAQWAVWRPGATAAICEPVRPRTIPPAQSPPAMLTTPLVREATVSLPGLPVLTCDLTVSSGGRIFAVAEARRWWAGAPLPQAQLAGRRRSAAGSVPAGSSEIPGAQTPFGWSFIVEPADDGTQSRLPMPAGPMAPPTAWFMIEVELRAGLPRIGGRPVAPAAFARQIAACPGRRGRPILLSTVGPAAPASVATAMYGALADALGTPVIAADGPIRVDRHGDLQAPSRFRSWSPKPTGTKNHEIVDLGHFLRARPARVARLRGLTVLNVSVPAVSVATSATTESPEPQPGAISAELVALLDRRWSTPPIVGSSADQDQGETDHETSPETSPETDHETSPETSPETDHETSPEICHETSPETDHESRQGIPEEISKQPAIWIGPRTGIPPRPVLRAALGPLYDVCGRFAARLLAEQPGMRVGRDRNDLLAALTALRAYCLEERDFVNATLRSGTDIQDADRATTLATWTVRGLESCPSTLGPVFRPGTTPPELLAAYRPGTLLAEPGFLDVELELVPRDGATVEYLIWSLTARRLDRLTEDTDHPKRAPIALFPPNSRFEVLAVDRPDPSTEQGMAIPRWRVLLRQLLPTDTPGDEAAERTLNRLRAATADAVANEPTRPEAAALESIDLWTFGVDQGPAAPETQLTLSASTIPAGEHQSDANWYRYAPGLDHDGARYDPSVSRAAALQNSSISQTPIRGAQR